MSCLLPFPYTPNPNEQRGAGPPNSTHHDHFFNPSLPTSGSVLPDSYNPSCCGQSYARQPVFSLLLLPPILQTPHLSYSLRPSAPRHVASPLRGWRPVTWHGLRDEGQNCHSPMAYMLTQTHAEMWAPQRHVHTNAPQPHMHVYIVYPHTTSMNSSLMRVF